MTTEKNRTQRVNVRLNADMADRLTAMAEQMGLAPTTLAAYAIGEYVHTKESLRKNQATAAAMGARQAGAALERMLSDPNQLKGLFGAMGLDEEQLQLPDLGEEGSGSLD